MRLDSGGEVDSVRPVGEVVDAIARDKEGVYARGDCHDSCGEVAADDGARGGKRGSGLVVAWVDGYGVRLNQNGAWAQAW